MRNTGDAKATDPQDQADKVQPQLKEAMDKAGVPRRKRAKNAGGDMSETARSRVNDASEHESSEDLSKRH